MKRTVFAFYRQTVIINNWLVKALSNLCMCVRACARAYICIRVYIISSTLAVMSNFI